MLAGVWAWALNLHYLSLLKIDVPALIKHHSRAPSPPTSHHQRTYQLALTATLPLLGSLLLFWLVTHGQPKLVLAWDWLPQSYLFLLFLFFAVPLPRWSHTGRSRLLSTLRRVSLGGIAESQDGKFGDILLADVLTSYAKVLGDLFVSICMFFSSGISSTGKPDRSCGGQFIVPLIISIPSLIRLRQCLIEFARVRRHTGGGKSGGPSSGWGGQHLANALKYSSAFPVVILSALQRNDGHESLGVSEKGLFRLWYVSIKTTKSIYLLFSSLLLYCSYLPFTHPYELTLTLFPTGFSPSSSTPSTPSTGTSPKTGTSLSSPPRTSATRPSILGPCAEPPNSILQ